MTIVYHNNRVAAGFKYFVLVGKPSILLKDFSFSKCQAIAVHKLLKDSLHKNMTWNRRALSVENSVSLSHQVSMGQGP